MQRDRIKNTCDMVDLSQLMYQLKMLGFLLIRQMYPTGQGKSRAIKKRPGNCQTSKEKKKQDGTEESYCTRNARYVESPHRSCVKELIVTMFAKGLTFEDNSFHE